MSTGYITVKVFTAEKAMPVQRAQVRIIDLRIALDQTIYTDQYGNAERIKVYAPEKELSLKPQDISLPYETYNIEVVKDGYIPTIINNVPVFPGEVSLLPVGMMPQPEGQKFASLVNNFELPPNGLLLKGEQPVTAPSETYNPLQTKPVFIPEVIRVHLGEPGSEDKTVLVPFSDYVKNVASSEIYATWPHESLKANVFAIISYALNRIYSGFYPSKGYNYDVTSDPDNDPYYVDGRNIYGNINDLVNEIFNEYIRRIGFNEPLLANYCNGITARCEGLSQWGSVTLANQGKAAIDIIKYYYGNVQQQTTEEIRGVEKIYPGKLLRLGEVGENVMTIQKQLNQIGKTYNNIPDIPVENGNFDAYTQDAVRAFQKQFNLSPDGIVGKKTWYQLAFVYNAARRLLDLSQSRKNITVPESAPKATLKEGDRGADVRLLQYLLNAVSIFYNSVFPAGEDGIFGKTTTDSVKSFQKTFSLSQTGTVDAATWEALFNVYRGIENQAGAVLDLLEGKQPGGQREQTAQSREGRQPSAGQNAMLGTTPGMPTGTTGPGMGTGGGSGMRTAGSGTQGASSNTDQRISEAMNYANGAYPFGNRGQINMAYSSDIMDYMPDMYPGKNETEMGLPGIPPFQTNTYGMPDDHTGSSRRGTSGFGTAKPGSQETEEQNGISKGGKWRAQTKGQTHDRGMTDGQTGGMQSKAGSMPQGGSFYQPYTPGKMEDQMGIRGAGRPQSGGQIQNRAGGQSGDVRYKQGTQGNYSNTPGNMDRNLSGGYTGNKPDETQSGTAAFQMYNPWITDDQAGAAQYDSRPSLSRMFNTWMADDQDSGEMRGTDNAKSDTEPFEYTPKTDEQPFEYTPWMMRNGSSGPRTGGAQPDTPAFDYYYEPADDTDTGTQTGTMSGMQTGPTAPQPGAQTQQGPAGMQKLRMPGGEPFQPLGHIYQMRSQTGNMPMPQQGATEPPRTGTSDEMECPPLPIASPAFQNKVLKIGSKGKDVQLMQEYLSYIALSLIRYKKIANELKVVVNDGIFGIDTTDAVIRFQNRYDMPVNGVIDAPTWAKIVEEYNSPCD